MIKLSKYFYINPLTVVLFVFCYINRQLELLCCTYAIMMVHELSHLLAAVCIGLKPAYIALHPFGVNLKLRNKFVYSLADEIILYLAGPVSNALMALAALLCYLNFQQEWLKMFYWSNLMLFVMNLMPVVPLDGGIILKKFLNHRLGYKAAEAIMVVVSVFLILFFVSLSIYLIWNSAFNFSVIFLCVFLIGNIFTQKEKYNIDFVKELMFYKEKGKEYHKLQVQTGVAGHGEDLRKIAQRFRLGSFFIIFLLNPKGEIEDILTETQVIEEITGGRH